MIWSVVCHGSSLAVGYARLALIFSGVLLLSARSFARLRAFESALDTQWPFAEAERDATHVSIQPLDEMHAAVNVMQNEFFELWLGSYPDSIDWTGAVVQTHLSAALRSISSAADYHMHGTIPAPFRFTEDRINTLFSHSTGYYFGENALSIRGQAHDDMQWVVLGWLESIRFINLHNALHHSVPAVERHLSGSISQSSLANIYGPFTSLSPPAKDPARWWGKEFENVFAHRARVFYDIVARAWDRKQCGGGITWNPRLKTYKNSITNTQLIAVSSAMYLYHPGDLNPAPFSSELESSSPLLENHPATHDPPAKPHDQKWLALAVEAYDWLKAVRLKNSDGLFVDGYHISKKNQNHSNTPSQCDERNEMVYSYNQGVVLSGLRQLWEGTGNSQYLEDGHDIVRDVLHSTGWVEQDATVPYSERIRIHHVLRGNMSTVMGSVAAKIFRDGSTRVEHSRNLLGYRGILTEFCDPSGSCGQDAQAFKGIFMHHLTAFCNPLPISSPLVKGVTYTASRALARLHRNSCRSYGPWVALNARAALATKNKNGIMGGWWGASISIQPNLTGESQLSHDAEDVWNDRALLESPQWQTLGVPIPPKPQPRRSWPHHASVVDGDWNDRGRGRTLESHASGLAVVRACWEFLRLEKEDIAT